MSKDAFLDSTSASASYPDVNPGTSDAPSNADASLVPISCAELNEWYTDHLLSLHEIAERASARLSVPISKTKVREWLLILQIPRRSFSQAARARAQKRRTSQAPSPERPVQMSIFADEDLAG